MKTLYIECSMGASGDMLQGALADLLNCKDEFVAKMNSLGLKDVEIKCERAEKCGITGEKVSVMISGYEECEQSIECTHKHHHEDNAHHHEHHHHHEEEHIHNHSHSSLSHIEEIIDSLDVSEKVKRDSKAVFQIIAMAESKVHGKPISDIHFHEVGSMDAVCDIIGFGLLMEKLGADRVVTSPINTGKGTVKCAHGILPVPAPATALILEQIPCYSNEISGELCTPTGAALLRYYTDEFRENKQMKYSHIGYGLGSKDFEAANVLRVFLCEDDDIMTDTVVKLESNIDDMTPEDLAYAQNLLMKNGALDVFVTPVIMKKSRAGFVLNCLCRENDKEKLIRLIFANTSTIGIRESFEKRYILERKSVTKETSFGKISVKLSEGYGTGRYKIEHDCLEKLANEFDLPINDVRLKLEKELDF